MNQPQQESQSLTADQKLTQSINALPDFQSSYSSDATSDNSTQNTDGEDRGTPNTTSAQENQTAGVEQTEADNKTSASPNVAESKKPKGRLDVRLQELLDENKALKAKLQTPAPQNQAQAQQQQPDAKPKERKNLIPPPEKPRYTRQQLIGLIDAYEESGDKAMVKAAREELYKVDQYEHEVTRWELKEGRAWEQYQANQNYYRAEAVKKWPDLAKTDSPIFREFQKVSQIVPELLERPDGEWLLASLANVRIQAARADALEAELKTEREKYTSMAKRAQPGKQTESTRVGSEPGEDADSKLTNGLLALAPRLSARR